jgi:outer membrane protein
MNSRSQSSLLVALVLATGILRADPVDAPAGSVAARPPLSPWRVGIALGYGRRSNPLVQSEPVPVAVDLDIAWFGKRFFFDNGDLGLTLSNRPSGTLNVIARVNSDRVFFSKTNTRFVQTSLNGAPLQAPVNLQLPKREYAIEIGVEYLADGNWGRLALAGFHDVSDIHGGFSIDAEYAYSWYGSRWSFEPTLLLRFKSRALNDYYWGVSAAESNAALPAYSAGAGINWQVGARGSYYLTKHLRIVASFNLERLSEEIDNSPLTRRSDVVGYFAGFGYQF